ncbi:MAG TPA: T9SS type A sorting domain-containing protein [Bacteroidetes bacterium]|nr:T9SS type A sorting domain-containing protein [Bacteroidota bacterium]
MNKLIFILPVFFLSSVSISHAQETDKITPVLAKKILAKNSGNDLTVWIYFTDKGANLDQKLATAEQALGRRSLERRKRSLKNKALISFYDVPVLDAYIEEVSPLLTKLRHRSKWLNAISATVKKNKLSEIAALSFVKSIDIVRKGKYNIETLHAKGFSKNIINTSAAYTLDYGPSLTQLEQINVPLVHDLGYSGEGIIVCLLDAGFRNINIHPAFSNMDILDAYDFVNDDNNVDDQPDDMGTGSHGTITLSTAGGFVEGELIGPAYNATFLLAKTENTESETQVEEDNWVAGAEWAEAKGADITSTSLGYVGFDDGTGYAPEDMDGNTAIITIASDIMAGLGVLVVNAAGNSGGGITTIGAPADGDSVLAIGAVNADGIKAGFSSVGPTADGRIKPDVMAMGAGTYAATGDSTYSTFNGTSLSCPLVAGGAALLWEMVPMATNMEIFEALKMSADNADNPNNEYGWGIIDIYAAYEYLVSQDTVAPVALCQNAAVELGMDGTATIGAIELDDGSTDNIGISAFYINMDTFTCDNIGTVDVTLTVVDMAGIEGNCTATVTVADNIAPVIDADILLDINAECEVINLPMPTATDNCAGSIIAVPNVSLPITAQGITQVTWTYDDGNGNIAAQTQNVILEDISKPNVVTQDITIDMNGEPSISIVPNQIDAGSTDNCGIGDMGLDISTFTAIGDYAVILSVEDINGNIATGTAIVSVINSIVGIADKTFADNLIVYPNPANDKAYLDFDNGSIDQVEIGIYNITGQLIKTINAYRSHDLISLSEIANGLYVFKVRTNDEIHFVKLMVAR